MPTEPDFVTITMLIVALAGVGVLLIMVANKPHQ